MATPVLDRFTSKTDTMQAMLTALAHGYTRWTSGRVPEQKAQALVLKFCDRYAVDADSQQRWRRKARGDANARLFMLGGRDEPDLEWWLLVTAGSGLVDQMEALHLAKDKRTRLTVPGGYEAVQTPRDGGAERWTWRMTADTVKTWKTRIHKAVQGGWPAPASENMQVQQVLYSLVRVPAFHGVRQQAFDLVKFARQEWDRSPSGGFENPFGAVYIPWVGRYKKPRTAPVAPRRRKAKEEELAPADAE